MQNLLDLFATFAERGARIALVYRTGVRRRQYSYGELADLALRMNGWLAAHGVGKGDRVLLWGPNGPWWMVAFWGIMARGAIAVPVDFMSGVDRAETIASLTSAGLVIQSRYKLELVTGYPAVFLEDMEFLLGECVPLLTLAAPDPDDPAQLIYTSGTTGNPKGVILTHRNLIANLLQIDRHIPIVTPDYTFLSLLPLSHMFEQMGGFFTPLYRGGCIVYLRTLKPSAILEALAEEDVYAVIAVPRLLQLLKGSIERELEARHLGPLFCRLLTMAEKLPLGVRKLLFFPVQRKFGSDFKFFVSGGAPLSPEIFRFWSNLGFTVLEGYGLTECSPVLTANPLERQVVGAVGRPLPGVEIRLENGEIQARGENITPGYYRNEQATIGAFSADGWFRTGDLGEFDQAGFLHIKGRLKELIVTGAGINVYPDEIEEELNRTGGVRESCVIGLDRGGGEEVHAVLLLDGSGRQADEIVREVNDRLDSLHQITGFSNWPEAEFPKTTTLKIRKFLVKEQLLAKREGGDAGGAADRLITIIARITGAPAGGISEESCLVTDLGLSSIARLELVNYLEQEFRLDLEDSLIGPQTRVADLRAIIGKRERPGSREPFRFWTNSAPVRWIRKGCDLLIHYPLLRCFVRLETVGLHHLEEVGGPVFFIANHVSYLDQPAIMFALPPKWRYGTATAAWAEFFFRNFKNVTQKAWKRFTYEYGTFGLNLFPLPQSGGFRGSLEFMGKLADHGINILVFPEGERSPDGHLLPFQRGLGIMVQELGIPVVPVHVAGLEQVLPRGARWPRRGRVTVTFGAPLRFRQDGVDQIVAKARQAVMELGAG
jgi:long-chain acyl-CoA synthetase